jgi:hypothetical protein
MDEKANFLRNAQLQKLYNEYNFDRDRNSIKEVSTFDKSESTNKPESVSQGMSDKTTKFTTINTIGKLS